MATGEFHTVREFIEKAFKIKGFDIKWKGEGVNEVGYDGKTGKELIFISDRYFRPTEVQRLLGDPSKAKKVLDWQIKHDFDYLVKDMVENDCK